MAVIHRLATEAHPELTLPLERRRPGRVRVGFISDRLTNSNGSRFALGWLNRFSPEIETYAFNLAASEDNTSLAFRRSADRYFHLPVTVSEFAPLIRSYDLDALIFTNIGMAGGPIQAAALRLARTQLSCWGHPVTSGSPTLDYYLSSELMEPPNGDDHYSETLIRLPGSGVSYPRAPLEVSAKTPSQLGVPEDGFLLMCQFPPKLTPNFDEVYLEIAARSSKPLVFLEAHAGRGNEVLRERLGKTGQNTIVLPRQTPADYLRLLQLADTSVDSVGWSGGNTTIDALTLGTPVVSLPGEFMRGRHSLAFLTRAGVPGLLAKDIPDFIELALDRDRQRSAMSGLDVDALYGDPAPAQAIGDLLLSLVHEDR
jgi:predicted O-linked N-acetylglucosamine transferase (SPINDLY family)